MRAFQRVFIFATALCLFIHEASAQQPATLRADAWTTDGQVFDIEQSKGIIYVGGKFENVIMNTGSGAALDMRTALPVPLPQITGTIHAVVADGAGGWYVGGAITKVGDATRKNLVHILSNGTLDLAWKPEPEARVHALALHGSTLYVGGEFTKIDGQTRNNIAALNATTGKAIAWNPNAQITSGSTTTPTGATVRALAVDGQIIYAGGSFNSIGGATRLRIAALDSANGKATAWTPDANGTVRAITVAGSTVYAGGNFTKIGRANRSRLAALDMVAGDTTAWNPKVEGASANSTAYINAIEVIGRTVYVGGFFTMIDGVARKNIAAIEASDGRNKDWQAEADGEVFALAANASAIYAAGIFTKIGTHDRKALAALDVDNGAALLWNPILNFSATVDTVRALAISGLTVYAGGAIKSISVARKNLAAFNASTGKPMTWNPMASDTVYALAVSGATVYAGGRFAQIGTTTKNRLAAIHAMTGNVTGWNPSVIVGARVNAIEVTNKTIYIGGSFTKISVVGQGPDEDRFNFAALDSATGKVSAPLNPNVNGQVRAFVVRDAVVYVAGDFSSINGKTRNALAAINAKDGTVLEDWNPDVSGGNKTVHALALGDSTLYAGGNFTTVGGQPHTSLVAIKLVSGMPIGNWNPNIFSGTSSSPTTGIVRSLAIDGSTVYVGGEFNRVDGGTRNNVAAVRVSDGFPTGWIPEATVTSGTASVTAFEVDGETVYAGGSFSTITGKSHTNFSPLGETPLNPVPIVTTMSPTIGVRLETININFTGTNFSDEVTAVNVGSGIAVNSITVNSSTSMTANITITAKASLGVRNFSVSNNPPGGGAFSFIPFTVGNPTPAITSINPASGLRGQTLVVTVSGVRFVSGVSSVSFGSEIIVNSITVNSSTRLTATITIGDNAATGKRDVVVINAFPGGTAILRSAFTVGYAVPTLISLAPDSGVCLQTLDVTCTGTGFINGITTLKVGDGITINSLTVMSATSLKANLRITAAAATGERNFTVINAQTGGGASANKTFAVNIPKPVLARISPESAGRGLTHQIKLIGENFLSGASKVNFGPDIIVNNPITVVSDTQIVANITIPLDCENGPRDVAVINAAPGGGTATLAEGFSVVNPRPALISIVPTIGALNQTLNVSLTGTNFIDGISSVDFGEGIAINDTRVVSSTQIIVNITIASDAPMEPHDVSAANDGPGGGGITLAKAFAVTGGTIVRFSVPDDLVGTRGDTVEIGLRLNPANRKIGSFDARLSYDATVLKYVGYTPGPLLSNAWQMNVNVNAATVNIGAYTEGNTPVTQAGTAIVLRFRVYETARIGTRVPLTLSYLAATNNNAGLLPTEGSDGVLTIVEATINGNLYYYVNDKPIAGDSVRLEIAGGATQFRTANADGFFQFSGFSFGRATTLRPRQMVGNFPAGIITAGDALRAFKGRENGPDPLNGYQSLAMDVNHDSTLTSGDAQAILLRAVGKEDDFYQQVDANKKNRLDDWCFVDADFNITAENWFEAPGYRRYSPLTEDQTEQHFIGIIRGDVNGSFAAPLAKKAGEQDSGPMVTVSNPVLTENKRFTFTVAVNTTDRAYNSFDLAVNYDAAAVRITGVALATRLTPQEWLSDWHAPQPGLLRIAGFALGEAVIKGNNPLLVIEGTLTRPAKENERLNLAMPFAVFGWNGKEIAAQTATGDLKFVASLPQQYALEQNYPNPFLRQTPRAATTIKYALPEAGVVSLRIYDVLGNVVRTLVAKSQNAGIYTVAWNGRKDNGSPAVSGMYFYRLEAGAFVKTNKLVLQK